MQYLLSVIDDQPGYAPQEDDTPAPPPRRR